MSDDLLDMLAASREKGGFERKEAIKNLWMVSKSIVPDRIHIDYGKDKGGVCKIRYGPNNYKVLDVDVEGRIYAYYECHWKKRLSKEEREQLIERVTSIDELSCSADGSNQYVMLEQPVEDQSPEVLSKLMHVLISHIEQRFYPEELRIV